MSIHLLPQSSRNVTLHSSKALSTATPPMSLGLSSQDVLTCYCLSQLQDPEPPRDRLSLMGHQRGPPLSPRECVDMCMCVYVCQYTFKLDRIIQTVYLLFSHLIFCSRPLSEST